MSYIVFCQVAQKTENQKKAKNTKHIEFTKMKKEKTLFES